MPEPFELVVIELVKEERGDALRGVEGPAQGDDSPLQLVAFTLHEIVSELERDFHWRYPSRLRMNCWRASVVMRQFFPTLKAGSLPA